MHKHTCPVCDTTYDETDDIRSLPHLRRYFAMIKAAHFHWPEWHPRQFEKPRALRIWLQMRAGGREIGRRVPLDGMRREDALLLAEAAINGADSDAIPTIHEGELIIWKPKSIAFAKLKHYDAVDLFEKVAAVIHAETNVDPNDMMKHAGP